MSIYNVVGTGDLLTNDQVNNKIEKIQITEALKDADFAHWCPPCRKFTPNLTKIYKTWKKAGHRIEIIFASSDRDSESFLDYYKSMPWLAFPHGDKRKETLSSKYGVGGIPWLVILDKSGNIVQNEADGTVMQDGEDAIKEWIK